MFVLTLNSDHQFSPAGSNKKLATKYNLCVHPNPYLLAEVLFDELRVGNPNLKSKQKINLVGHFDTGRFDTGVLTLGVLTLAF